MHRMAGALSDYVADQRAPDQCQVADQVEHLVPAALIGKPEPFRIANAGTGEADSVGERSAANQAHITHLVQIALEAERASPGDLTRVWLRGQVDIDFLASSQWMPKIGGARYA